MLAARPPSVQNALLCFGGDSLHRTWNRALIGCVAYRYYNDGGLHLGCARLEEDPAEQEKEFHCVRVGISCFEDRLLLLLLVSGLCFSPIALLQNLPLPHCSAPTTHLDSFQELPSPFPIWHTLAMALSCTLAFLLRSFFVVFHFQHFKIFIYRFSD